MTVATKAGQSALTSNLRAVSDELNKLDENNARVEATALRAASGVEKGNGPDTLVLNVSSDHYQGAADFTVSVNGEQVGGTYTASASHGAGSDTVTLHGDWGANADVVVNFVNDLWEGSAETDRNLHIDGATYNGNEIAGASQTVWGNYGVGFTGSGRDGAAETPKGGDGKGGNDVVSHGQGADRLVLRVSSDSYEGDAEFKVHVNGKQVGDVFTAAASHGEAKQVVRLRGDWGPDAEVKVTFLNDHWGGSADKDRNLHIDSVRYNGERVEGADQVLATNSTVAISLGGDQTGSQPGGGATKPPADDDSGSAPPAGGGGHDGYSLVLADDFSNGYRAENWGTPFHGGTYWNGAFTWNGDDVAVRGGEMQVSMTRQADGSWTAGGFNSFKAGNTITYGKVEFDAKVPNEQGTMTAILTWPASDVWPADGEIDILETPGDENMFSTHYAGPNGDHWYDSVRSSSYDASKWHHYEMTWLPDRLTIEVDGQVMAEWTDPAMIPDVAHGFGAMGFVGASFDHWMGGAPDGSTPDQVIVSIDNVRMYQADAVF